MYQAPRHSETPEQCLEAVKSGEADAMLHNQYSIDRLLQKPRYESLNALAAEGIGDAQSLSPVLYKSGNDTLVTLEVATEKVARLCSGIFHADKKEKSGNTQKQ